MHKFSFFFFFLMTIGFSQQQITETIVYDGETREYILYIPESYQANEEVPLMFNFHGGDGYASDWILGSNMTSVADLEGFILVFPQALADPNDNGSLNWIHKDPTEHDDIYFVESMIDELASQYMIDQSRVYACGYSLGGEFTYEVLCRLNFRIAAGAAVARTMYIDQYNNCDPEHPTAIMTILGTNDNYEGCCIEDWGELYYVSANDMHEYWIEYNNADSDPIIVDIPNLNTSDGSTVERKTWANGANCVSVEELKVNNGGHDWPGSFGNMDINSDEEIWNFVSKHDINGLIDCSTSSLENIKISEKKIIKIIDVLGRELSPNSLIPLLFIYDDGSVQKSFKIF